MIVLKLTLSILFFSFFNVSRAANLDLDNPLDVLIHFMAVAEPFMEACLSGSVVEVTKLIREGANVDQPFFVNGSLEFPLILSAKCGHISVVQVLLKAGANVDIRDQIGRSAFNHAVDKGITDMVNTLVEYGANSTFKDIYLDNPLHLAIMNNCTGIVDYIATSDPSFLEDKDSDGQTCAQLACNQGCYEIYATLIDKGALIDCIDDDNETSLMSAVSNNRLEFVEIMIGYGLDPNLKNCSGSNCLHISCCNSCPEIVKFLLPHMTDIEDKDNEGKTALHMACEYDQITNVGILLEKKANIQAQDDLLWTPLHWACDKGLFELAKLLIECGAEVQALTIHGLTSKQVALNADRGDIVQWISHIEES